MAFVSDVHLYFGGEEYLRQFLAFLRDVGAKAQAVFIHGDLFDFYVGPRQGRQPFYRTLFEELRRMVAAGVEVAVLHGNRDFLMGRCFEEAGVAILPDGVTLRLGGMKVHLSHGDAFCIHDRSYQFWARGVLRAAPVRALVRSLPVWMAVWLAKRYRAVSGRKVRKMGEGSRLPTVFDGVRQLLGKEPFDAVICGHIHDLAETAIEAAGTKTRLLTTGAWEDGPNYVAWDGGRIEPRRWSQSQSSQARRS